MTGLKRRVWGKTVVLNVNAKKGYRVSPGVNARARAIQQCAKGKALAARKDCFRMGKVRGKAKKE